MAGRHTIQFVCDSGAKKLPVAQLNDNYCDCEDGSDEPGTSACSHSDARFHCTNAGYFPQNLPTSRVNDQICDCCDGSDEYASGTPCPLTCGSLMETFMTKQRGLLGVYEQGVALHEKLVEEAKAFWDEDQKQLAELEAELETAKATKNHLEKVKEGEELAETKEQMERTKEIKRDMMRKLGLMDLTHEQLGFIVLELANSVTYSKDDLLKFIKAERDPLDASHLEAEEAAWKIRDDEREKETDRITTLRDERLKLQMDKKKEREEAIERGETPAEEEEVAEEGEEEEELVNPPVEDRPVKLLFDQMATFGSHERPQAKQARDNYSETIAKLSTIERSVTDLKDSLSKAYGPKNVLYALRDKCFDTTAGQYTYSMCFFGKAKQDSTSLGEMQPLDPETTTETKEVVFTGGQTCWNGPARSLRVALECGIEPELYGVDEPSTCVYRATLKTPIACDEAYKARMLASQHEQVGGEGGVAHTAHHIELEIGATL